MLNYSYLLKYLPKEKIRLISDGFIDFPVDKFGKSDYLKKEFSFWRNKSSVQCGKKTLEISECLKATVYYENIDVRSLHFIDLLDQSFIRAFLNPDQSNKYCQTTSVNHDLILKNYNLSFKDLNAKSKIDLIAPSWGIHGAIFDENFKYIEKQVLDWLKGRHVFIKADLNSKDLKCSSIDHLP
jgi:hypothetical protein